MRSVGWIVALALAGSLAALAEPSVRLSVEQKEVAQDARFMVLVTAEGGRIGEFRLPEDLDGLVIEPRPSRNRTDMLFTNGRASMTVSRGYWARATRLGKVTIPPFGVQIDNRTFFSNSIELTVIPSASQPAQGLRATPDDTGVPRLEDLVFIRSEVDKTEVYQGEAVQLTLSLWQLDLDMINVEGYRAEAQAPKAEGFYAIPPMPAALSRSAEVNEGRRYIVTRHRQVLYPMRAGTLTVGEWQWEGGARLLTRFGLQYKDLSLRAPAITIRVKALPSPQPAAFTGAVGRYRFEGELSTREVAQGVPAQLVLRVIGEGNPAGIGAPVMPTVNGARIANPTSEVDLISDPDTIVAEKSFVYSVLPLKPGRLTLPKVSFAYFDPGEGKYKTLQAGPFALEVTPSAESSPRVTVDAQGSDAPVPATGGLRPILTTPGVLRPQTSNLWALAALVAAPPAAFLALAWVLARRRRFAEDAGYARAYHARTRGHRRLEQALESDEPAEDLYRALVGFLADKFDVEEAGMTSADADRLLLERGINGDTAQGILKILRATERARYGGASLSEDELRALLHAASLHMDKLQTEVGRTAR